MQGISQYSSENIKKLEKAVIQRFGISPVELHSRLRIGATARQMMFYLLSKHFLYSSTQIGGIYDRDHSSVLYGIEKVKSNKYISDQADAIFLSCLCSRDNSGEKPVDKLLINTAYREDNMGISLPYDEGIKSCPIISTPKSNKSGDNKSHTKQ